MKKFIITEEERKHIKGLYEQADPNAQAYNDLAGKELIKLYPNKEYLTQTADVISKRLDNETRTDNYIASSGEEVVGSGMNPNLLPYIKQLIQTNSGGKIKFSNTPKATTTPSVIGDKLFQAFTKLKTGEPVNDGLVDKSIQLLSRADVKSELTDMISTFKTSDELNLKLSSLANSPKEGEPKMAELIKKAIYIIRPELSKPPVSGVSQQPIAGEKINTTNDKAYDYKLANGKYFYSKKGLNQWIEAKGTGLNNIKTKVKF